ncbi:MAG: hypothetical protein HGA65_18155 [Oscillochloris sp.]|nr:hypothetical protein [Oscillochloris sp.]
MNDQDALQLQLDLLLEQATVRQLNKIVRQASEAVLLLAGNRDMEVSQLRNLLSVAVESRSVEVVINFIRYQIARNSRAWGIERGSFGHRVIEDLRKPLQGWTDAVLKEVTDRHPDHAEGLRERASVRLMQLYLGYLNRAFYAARRVDTPYFDTLKELLNSSNS